MEYLRLSWDDIEKQCEYLAKEIRKRGVKFDIIVGIARGGWIPARLLSDHLDNDELYTVRVKFYEGVGRRAAKPLIIHPTQFDVAGKNVLLIDDIADTGESLMAAIEHLKEKHTGSIFVATLVKKPHSKFTPDLFALATNAWVIFPWEVRETVRSLRDKSPKEAAKELKKAGIDEKEWRK